MQARQPKIRPPCFVYTTSPFPPRPFMEHVQMSQSSRRFFSPSRVLMSLHGPGDWTQKIYIILMSDVHVCFPHLFSCCVGGCCEHLQRTKTKFPGFYTFVAFRVCFPAVPNVLGSAANYPHYIQGTFHVRCTVTPRGSNRLFCYFRCCSFPALGTRRAIKRVERCANPSTPHTLAQVSATEGTGISHPLLHHHSSATIQTKPRYIYIYICPLARMPGAMCKGASCPAALVLQETIPDDQTSSFLLFRCA